MLDSPALGEPITLESLAVMIKVGFDGVDKRFKAVDRRFEVMDKKFEKFEGRFDRLEKKVDDLDLKVDQNHAEVMRMLDNCISKNELRLYDKRITAIEKRLKMPVMPFGQTSPT